MADSQEDEEDPLPALMGKDDPLRMKLTTEESCRAELILDTIYGTSDLKDLRSVNDFWVAQLAIVCCDEAGAAIDCAEGLQAFRETYKILDTYEQGCRAVQTLVELLPEYLLGLFFSPEKGTYVGVLNGANLSSRSLNTVERVDDFMTGFYYLLQANCPDLETIRKGMNVMQENAESNHTKRDFAIVHQMFQELLSVYPVTGSIRYYNTGVVFNMMICTMKVLLPKKLRDNIQTGCRLDAEGGALPDHFLLPNVEAATQRVLQQFMDNLKRRYENEQSFSLSL